ncbi:MAG: beta-Ala-His dipeptidase [Defluviitaleaceae bacterium]|nr:beta-Ala-His dipeptidase [Defluviitaleaceae bacterium]
MEKIFEKPVLNFFAEISKIPRGSGNEKAVSDYIAAFARERGAEVAQDEWYNLIIKKAASAGFEGKTPVLLQAHLDMVCEKNAGTVFDFEKDPIDLYVDGDFIKARGTTLGADDGIGVALCMALLDTQGINHPPLEIILTTDEEAGMTGAKNLDISGLKGTRLINLDTSNDDIFTMGCAAATTAEVSLPANGGECSYETCEVIVSGLKGGHSGADIHLERGNALRILALILDAVNVGEHEDTGGAIKISLKEINGGMKVNAIPREARAVFGYKPHDKDEIVLALQNCKEGFAEQYRASDAGLKIEWKFGEKEKCKFLTEEITQKIIHAMLLIPTGELAKSLEIEGLVNASSNMGVVETAEEQVLISSMARGAARFYTYQIERQFYALREKLDTCVHVTNRSPAWPFNPKSELLKTAMDVFEKQNGRKAEVTAVHAGLECGIFSSRFEKENDVSLDMISFSANSYDYHTPDERLSISSVERVWKFLQELLGAL